MSADLIQTIDSKVLRSKDEVYKCLSTIGNPVNEKKLVTALKEREREGNIKIAEQVLLPHIETELVSESKVVILRLEEPLIWDESTGKIKVLFTVFLKTNESDDIKQRINVYIRKLADEEYISRLLTTRNLSKSI